MPLSDPASEGAVVEQIRKIGSLLAKLGAPFLVSADAAGSDALSCDHGRSESRLDPFVVERNGFAAADGGRGRINFVW